MSPVVSGNEIHFCYMFKVKYLKYIDLCPTVHIID